MELFSPAKINLFFKLVEKRADGYHNLESLFQAVDLFDRIELNFSEQDHFSSNTNLGFNEDNFLIKALFCFREKTGLKDPVHIVLEKNIPMEAGLGGGSSNAATLLWGLNELYDRPASLEQLQNWSSEITCDSPFFFSKGTALCTQKGEVVQNLDPLTFKAWLIKPKEGNSTPKVYQASANFPKTEYSKEELLKRIYSPNPLYLNDLEAPAFSLSPFLSELKKELINQGHHQVFMTGSGTALVCTGKNKPLLEESLKIFEVDSIQREKGKWYQKPS